MANGKHNPLGRSRYRVPDWFHSLFPTGWSITNRGYVKYTARPARFGLTRGVFMHRAMIDHLLCLLPPSHPMYGVDTTGWHIHHQDCDKTHNCPENLLLAPGCFNPSPAPRCPVTGRFLSAGEVERMKDEELAGSPSWVRFEDTF